MGDVLVPSLTQVACARIRKRRELPRLGIVLVKKEDRVDATTIVASAELPGEVHIVRIADQLGIDPSTVLKKLTVAVDQSVDKGQVLFSQSGLFGLFSSKVVAPVDGVVEFISESLGHVAIREKPRLVSLQAYLGGEVVEVIQDSGVVIEADATLVQGIFGVGGERFGEISILDLDGSEKLSLSVLPTDCKGKIIVGGTLPSLEIIKTLEERGAVGLVVGAIDDQALRGYLGYDLGLALTGDEDIGLTIIVTEGFGNLALSPHVYELLSPHQGKMASINGATQVRAGALRPEIIVVTEVRNNSVRTVEGKGLEIGSEVRMVRVPYFGILGKIDSLPVEPQVLESGSLARVAKVTLADGSLIVVPRANVEVVDRNG